MYGTPYDLMASFLGVAPARLRGIVARWRRVGYVQSGRLGPGPAWCWLTRPGLAVTGQRYAPVPRDHWRLAPEAFADAAGQLGAYFAGERTGFDLDLAPRGTPFQQRIWRALDSVRYGTTITYGELAAQLGVPRDRIVALGAAVGANPLLIVRPPHGRPRDSARG